MSNNKKANLNFRKAITKLDFIVNAKANEIPDTWTVQELLDLKNRSFEEYQKVLQSMSKERRKQIADEYSKMKPILSSLKKMRVAFKKSAIIVESGKYIANTRRRIKSVTGFSLGVIKDIASSIVSGRK